MIAGGIEIKDLNALKKMGCWGVDLNSKLEDSPGIKNHELFWCKSNINSRIRSF